ncbi:MULTISPECIES: alpha/beta fold hydrolase [Variovorax]|jgi:pimeloyl-ACP methyl ester carboxylesterase|uniref:alpha/beta fold hydrolase n=1 Tax=Variovorax TaxID=34072 RepID=UPI0008C24C29|nr:alpha/beta hydrolase [Variovorax sp. OV084]SET44357.1 Pimeloyl-ACP methyl ester carboxylesterase [Variovorax sp. OV084]
MSTPEFAAIDWRGRTVRIECQWIAPERTDAPLIVFLHEGLGSVAMWKDFPARVCEAASARGLVFSRPGYGRSTPRADDEIWDVDFMHRQAHEVLPALFTALGLGDEKLWLFGHSDGGSIALLYASRFPEKVEGLIVLAPHIFVEDKTVANIEIARTAYLGTDLPKKLGRYHDSADSAFWGWNRIWLHPPFRDWNIEAELDTIRCPVLAVQGIDDEYGTLAQIRGIAARVSGCELLEIPECGHSPHRDQPDRVIVAATSFITKNRRQTP